MGTGEPLRVGVVGVAGIGRTHLSAFRSLAQEPDPTCVLAAICDANPVALEAAERAFEVPRAYPAFDQLLADPEVDVISLCVPHFLHRQMALATIRAGKHLLLEKPVGMNYGEAMEIADAAAAGSATTGVIFQSRFDPSLRFVRDEILPELGAIRSASSREYHWRGASYYAEGAWRGTWKGEGGGLFINQCIHGWDVMQWLLGGVEHAYGYWANLLHPTIEVEDIGYASIRFRGLDGEGVFGKTVATTCLSTPGVTDATPWERRVPIHIIGEHGEVTASDFRAPRSGQPQADFRMKDDRLDRDLRQGMEEAVARAAQHGEAADHRTNIHAFLNAVRAGAPAPVTPESAAGVQKIIDGIHWHGWNHTATFRDWAASQTPLPADADAARQAAWDGGDLWRTLLSIAEDEGPGLKAPFLPGG